MAHLTANWLTEGWIDFEYKRYLLLSYLQETSKTFGERKLYPRLAELVDHYHQLHIFKETKQAVARDFPKAISRVDFEQFKIEYRTLFDDPELLKEIDSIVDFALPQIEHNLKLGKQVYEEVEDKLEVFPVGIIPLRTEEGYFFLAGMANNAVNVYAYTITIFESKQEKYRGINTRLLFSYNTTVSQTYEKVKVQLIKQHKNLPNPATYAVTFKKHFPLAETMLPVAKRSLVKFIAGNQM